jgi:hypothetical protein
LFPYLTTTLLSDWYHEAAAIIKKRSVVDLAHLPLATPPFDYPGAVSAANTALHIQQTLDHRINQGCLKPEHTTPAALRELQACQRYSLVAFDSDIKPHLSQYSDAPAPGSNLPPSPTSSQSASTIPAGSKRRRTQDPGSPASCSTRPVCVFTLVDSPTPAAEPGTPAVTAATADKTPAPETALTASDAKRQQRQDLLDRLHARQRWTRESFPLEGLIFLDKELDCLQDPASMTSKCNMIVKTKRQTQWHICMLAKLALPLPWHSSFCLLWTVYHCVMVASLHPMPNHCLRLWYMWLWYLTNCTACTCNAGMQKPRS